MALESGQTINNRYRIVKLLGQGGFGAVYRAWDNNLRKPCALKENLDISPEAQRQFNREATVLANLSHPHLPRVTDYFTIVDQGQYLVMDFVEGEDMASLIQRQGPVKPDQAVNWISQVADAVSYLHQRETPVVHRDIKPANIRITPQGNAMLVDFGLVKLFDPKMKTTIGARAVTPGFAPPEQYGQGSTDSRTDIYALGATLYNIITNQLPLESIRRMVGGKMKTAAEIDPTIPQSLNQIIEQAMALEPSQRFQTAQEFKTALNQSLKLSPAVPIHRPVESAVVVSPVMEQQVSPAMRQSVSAAGPDAVPGAAPRAKGRFTMGLGVGVIAVLVLCIIAAAGLGYWAFNSQANSATQTAVAEIQGTTDERVRLTATSQGQQNASLDSTEQARLTAAAGAAATETAQAGLSITAQSLDGYIQNILNNRTIVAGPVDGEMTHNAEDQLIADFNLPVDLRDFVVEVSMINPYSPSTGAWDYGILFRHEEANRQFRLVLRSQQDWVLLNNSGDPDGVIIQEGRLPNLRTGEGESNFIRLICQDTQGYFYLNDALVGVLDLSVRTNSGDIFLATGMYLGNEITGYSTKFSQYTVWSID